MARLLFIQNIDYEFLGPMYISSSAAAAGHECRMALGQTIGEIADEVAKFKPDLAGFSVMSGSHRWAIEMARNVKREFGIPNIIGGAHPTFFPECIREKDIDMILRGEGEESVVELLNCIDAKKSCDVIPNIWHKNGSIVNNPMRPLRSNLDDYPFPDRALYNALEGKLDRGVRNVITSRGCPWHCTFCFEDAMRELYSGKGKYVRLRNIESVLEECRELKETTNVRTVYFADDVFGMSTRWLYEFLPRYKKEIGLPFICLVRADIVAEHPEYASRLAEGGCASVFFGIESGDEALRNQVLEKQLSNMQICSAAELLHDAGIPFRTYNIVALPGETLEQAYSTVDLNISIRADYPWCSVFSPFPGTALTEYAIRGGYLRAGDGASNIAQSFFSESVLSGAEVKRLENLQKFFQTAVLWPRSFPLIKNIIRLPPNIVFTLWFGLVYFYIYVKSEQRGFWKTFRFGLKNYRHILAKQ